MVARHFAAVTAAGAMDRTVFVYTSDHGYHSGQWGVPYCKMLPYEEDVRVPMFVRIPKGSIYGRGAGGAATIIQSPVLSIDLAPTLLDLAGYTAAAMDGRSFLHLLKASTGSVKGDHVDITQDRAFLVEYWPIPHGGEDVQVTTRGLDGWCTDPDVLKTDCPILPITVDSVNNTYACVRTLLPSSGTDTLFCLFWDGNGWDNNFPRTPAASNFVEYYDLETDPWQLTNRASALNTSALERHTAQLAALMQCQGNAACQVPGYNERS